MKLFKYLLGALLFAGLAFAQDDISINPQPVGGGKYLGGKTVDNQLTIPMVGIDSNGNTVINALSGKSVLTTVDKTPGPVVNDPSGVSLPSGKGVKYAPYVPTMAATPSGATNQFRPGLNVIPTNAANNAAFLGAVTVTPGEEFIVTNASGANQRVKAAGGATLNGATAGGYYVIADKATITCRSASATNQTCEAPAIPTAAGP